MSNTRLSINSGELAMGYDGEVISTVVGSCIAVCIFDERLHIGGMNHYLLAENLGSENDGESPLRYGSQAIPALLNEFKRAGSRPADLRAKIIGGAHSTNSEHSQHVGTANAAIARHILAKFGVRILAEEVGGRAGRRVEFNTFDGSLRFKKDDLGGADQPGSTARTTFTSQATPADHPKPVEAPKPREPTKPALTLLAKPKNLAGRKIKVLLIDDSAPIRRVLSKMLSADPDIEIVGEAEDPVAAEVLRKTIKPDVITLDLHMPNQDGVSYLRQFMPLAPVPTIIVTDFNLNETGPVMDALDSGAFDYFQKPAHSQLAEAGPILIAKIKAAAQVKPETLLQFRADPKGLSKKTSQTSGAPLSIDQQKISSTLIAIGASTGGTEALKVLLTGLPAEIPPILIVQHMPPGFTKSFADRLNELCPFAVKEAVDGEKVVANCVYIAPGGVQMAVVGKSSELRIRISDDPPENRFKPSVDYLFRSFGQIKGKQRMAAILTGMGGDGAKEMLNLRKMGVHTIAQNEATCVVFGMPKVAIDLGAACEVKALDQIASSLALHLRKKAA